MRFTTADPLYGKYPDLSPWSHCAANPVNAIDQNGMDMFLLDPNGQLHFTSSILEGDLIVSSTGSLVYLPENTISSGIKGSILAITEYGENQQTEIVDYTYFEFASNSDAAYEFFADNTNVEWCQMKFTDGKSIVGTSNNYYYVAAGNGYLKNNPTKVWSITEFNHTHLSEEEQSLGDVSFARAVQPFSFNSFFRIDYTKPFRTGLYYSAFSKYYSHTQIQELDECVVNGEKKEESTLTPN